MIEYSADKSLAFFNGMKYRRDQRTGYYLASCPAKGEKKRKRLHVAVWESVHGAVPPGMHIHHIDHDRGNNAPENLLLMCAFDHLSEHGHVVTERRRKSMEEIIRPAACAWHKSAEGRARHKQVGFIAVQRAQPREFVCEMCGKPFTTTKLGNTGIRFCSNACKSACRRRSGVDNVERKCACCGQTFIANKYDKTRYCSHDCARKVRHALRECGCL